MTERIYWRDARAKTAIATVTGHAAGGFTLDKSLYHAALAGYHHAQPSDLGHVLAEGHKLKLTKVHWDRDRLIHRTDGPIPAVGAKAQLHLDAPRRELQARAHAALHLLVASIAAQRGTLLSTPTIVGGGEARLHARFREPPATTLPRVIATAQRMIDERHAITPLWCARDDAAHKITHHIQALDTICPDEPTLRLIQIGPHSTLPCDAPLPQHAWQIGRLKPTILQPRAEGIRFGVKVLEEDNEGK